MFVREEITLGDESYNGDLMAVLRVHQLHQLHSSNVVSSMATV
jgi:hypothetical protein